MEHLSSFLRQQADRGYRYLLRELDGITAEEAFRDRLPHWPGHRWGVGQDGSIAGIVLHVTAWKHLTLPLFSPEGQPLLLEELDTSSLPNHNDWPAILVWFNILGAEWNARLAALDEEAFDLPKTWGNSTLTVAQFVVEMVEHDVQHAAQIEYLRHRHRALASASGEE